MIRRRPRAMATSRLPTGATSRHHPQAVAALALVVCVALGGARTVSAAETPEQVVDQTAQQVIDILANQNLSSDQKRHQIEDVVYARVDFVTLSKLVLARNWSKMSPAQQQAFTQEFRKHLSVTYGRNVDNYKNERLTIVSGRPEARGDYTVQSKIIRGGPDDIAVDYRLRQRDGQWLIIDIVVEGVSLVSNFRSQFQEIIANGGPDKLIELLREKNAKGEPLKS
jgi:phospholipid transport system substrate-binding protein